MARRGEYVFRVVMPPFLVLHNADKYGIRQVFAKNTLAVTSDYIKSYDNEVSAVLKIAFLPCALGTRIIIIKII